MFKPKTFPGQKPDEKTQIFLRRHWLSFSPSILITFLMLTIPIFIFVGLRTFGIELGELKSLVTLGTSSYLLFVLAFFLTAFIDYYLDICIVTNQRIVDIDQKGLFNREISHQDLIRVQDVTSKKRGIFQTFFDYGDVLVQTAGEAPNFEFLHIPKPRKTAQTILKLHHEILAKGYRAPEEPPPTPPEEEPPSSETKEIPREPEPPPTPPKPPSEETKEAPSEPEESPSPSQEPEKPEEKGVSEEELKKGGEIDL